MVMRSAEADLPTRYGRFRIIVYGVQYEEQEPVALVLGDLTAPAYLRSSACIVVVLPVI